MASERLDLRSARYDRLARSVMIDGRGVLVEVSLEALEALARKSLSPQDAVNRAVAEGKRLTALLKRLPPDDAASDSAGRHRSLISFFAPVRATR